MQPESTMLRAIAVGAIWGSSEYGSLNIRE